VSAAVQEAACTFRRLTRRRSSAGALSLVVLLLVYAGAVRPVASARDALSAASAIATLVLLVLAAGIVADDRERGRLAMPATHPAPPASWTAGRWLALWLAAAATLSASTVVLLAVTDDWRDLRGLALATAVAVAHLAALAALAVAVSCRVGATAQTLLLLGVIVAGAMPPELVELALPGTLTRSVMRALWGLLPTPWALGRLHTWLLAGGAPAPWLALALALQPPAWLAIAARSIGRAELPVRGT
jgi:hypothetical protein